MYERTRNGSSMLISIDIGSTWTKGALFKIKEQELLVIDKTATSTTTEDLSSGFQIVLDKLKSNCPDNDIPIECSSSAHGGLKITAIGIVPELTVESAKLAALSAGGKLTKSYSYRLNKTDVDEIEKSDPDIILLTGGTDGGNISYITHNAQLLSESNLTCPILYGGNKDLHDKIKIILSEKDLIITSNVLPELDSPSPKEAQEAVRNIFLTKIIQGKGLQKIVDISGNAPVPTPASIFEYINHLYKAKIFKDDFAVIDMGGATTDYYSVCHKTEKADVIKKGIKEPYVKRSVEGDLGMRVSAVSALESGETIIKRELEKLDLNWNNFKEYIKEVNLKTDYIPDNNEEKLFDTILCGYCTSTATVRHGGTRREIYTASGTAVIQKGRDLKRIKTIIGTGGFLAGFKNDPQNGFPTPKINEKGEELLSPDEYIYYSDKNYLIPLLANASRLFPEEAAASFISNLEKIR